jgi:hypothetical protein
MWGSKKTCRGIQRSIRWLCLILGHGFLRQAEAVSQRGSSKTLVPRQETWIKWLENYRLRMSKLSKLQNDVPNPSVYGVLRWNSEIWAPHGCQPADLGGGQRQLIPGHGKTSPNTFGLLKKNMFPHEHDSNQIIRFISVMMCNGTA